MTYKIVRLGDPVLRACAATVPQDQITNEATQAIVESLCLVLTETGGVGLAAPQIGISQAIAIARDHAIPNDRGMYAAQRFAELSRTHLPETVLINPQIVSTSPAIALAFETCLSFPEIAGVVPRAKAIKVRFYDARGVLQEIEFSGFPARIIQHEIDHLQGRVCLDRMILRTVMCKDQYYADQWPDRTAEEAIALLADGTA